MVVPSFSTCLSNISDIAPNAPITTGTTVTFFSFHNFLIPSLRSSTWYTYFTIFYSSLSFTRASPGMAMSMTLTSIACLSTNAMSGLRVSTIISNCTLKSHTTLKPLFSTTRSGGVFVPLIGPLKFCLSTQLPMHTSATLSWLLLNTCFANLLHSLIRWITLYPFSPHILHRWFCAFVFVERDIISS